VLIAHMATLVRQPIKQNIVNRTTYGLVVFVMIFSTGLQMNKRIQSGKLAIIQQNKLQAYVVDLNPTDKDIYLVWTGGTFPAEWASPFGGIRNLFANYHQVGVGTSFNSPLSRAQLRRFNLNNPYLDIVDNEYAKFILYSES
ncbi:MAG: hypothetical protein L3J05_01270, partial [Robiginitomaculum sp.]|nr:hypothetical protein [Robiginitomaculum sp.]